MEMPFWLYLVLTPFRKSKPPTHYVDIKKEDFTKTVESFSDLSGEEKKSILQILKPEGPLLDTLERSQIHLVLVKIGAEAKEQSDKFYKQAASRGGSDDNLQWHFAVDGLIRKMEVAASLMMEIMKEEEIST